MNLTQRRALAAVKENYDILNRYLLRMLRACDVATGSTGLCKADVVSRLNEALANYLKAQNDILAANEAKLAALLTSAEQAKKDIEKALGDLKAIVTALNKIKDALAAVKRARDKE